MSKVGFQQHYLFNYSTIDIVDEDGRKEIFLIFEKFYYIIWYKEQRTVKLTPSGTAPRVSGNVVTYI